MTSTREALAPPEKTGGKYLTFVLLGEEYGVPITSVHEIIGMMPITPMPQTPPCIRGIINLRGRIIPLVDLRTRFGMPTAQYTQETCTIVLGLFARSVGVIVDRVSEVIDIDSADIEPAPDFGAGVDASFIIGIGKSQGRVRILLDIEKALSELDPRMLMSGAA